MQVRRAFHNPDLTPAVMFSSTGQASPPPPPLPPSPPPQTLLARSSEFTGTGIDVAAHASFLLGSLQALGFIDDDLLVSLQGDKRSSSGGGTHDTSSAHEDTVTSMVARPVTSRVGASSASQAGDDDAEAVPVDGADDDATEQLVHGVLNREGDSDAAATDLPSTQGHVGVGGGIEGEVAPSTPPTAPLEVADGKGGEVEPINRGGGEEGRLPPPRYPLVSALTRLHNAAALGSVEALLSLSCM